MRRRIQTRMHWLGTAMLAASALFSGGPARATVTATGGDATIDLGAYRIHLFTNAGNHTFTVISGNPVDVLVVAGGGGGGTCIGGGGGAGGLIYSNAFPVLDDTGYAVTVGAGGAPLANGANSMFGPLLAYGGGRGGSWESTQGQNGGSGGGHAASSAPEATTGVSGQGHGGGAVSNNRNGGSGGGAAGTPGTNGISTLAGRGGEGLPFDISGESRWYAGGGGGGARNGSAIGAPGGLGGGGAGVAVGVGTNGVPNTGGGGGGGAYDGVYRAGGSGGSGIVIVRYIRKAAPLSAMALPATDVGLSTAKLHGRVGGLGDAENPTVSFCFGTADGGTGATDAWQRGVTVGSQWGAGDYIQYAAGGLAEGQRYYYRIYLTNSTGYAWSDLEDFTTYAKPVVVAWPAVRIGRSAATLRGELISTGGIIPVAGFEWWPVGDPDVWSIALGEQDGVFDLRITGLDRDRQYAFRTWASNELAGRVVSATETFRTLDWGPRTFTWTGVVDTDWFTIDNWTVDAGDPGMQEAGDSAMIPSGKTVLLTHETVELASFTITDSTLMFTNWMTRLRAADVAVQGNSVLTLPPAFTAAQMSNRVWIVCEEFDLAAGSMIDLNGRGYRGVNGAGRGGDSGAGGGGGGHGGYGGHGSTTYRSTGYGGVPNGAIEAPAGPGSGGGYGYSADFPGAAGGGAIRIQASGSVSVHGTIRANGDSYSGNWSGGGSGGAIHIVGDTFGGGSGGVIQADGGAGARNQYPTRGGGGGGGGRIAIHYNRLNGAPATEVSVKPGLTFYTEDINVPGFRAAAQPGTLYFSDPTLMDAILATRGGDTAGINGTIHFASTRHWTTGIRTLTASELGIPEGDTWRFTHALTLSGSRLWVDPMAELVCDHDMTLTNASALKVYGGVTNGLDQTYATRVQVAGMLRLATNTWVYPFAHSSDGGAPLFRVGSLSVAAGSGFNADGRGYARSTGHGRGTDAGNGGGGGGYGGKGGNGSGGHAGGAPYGNLAAPLDPGSGGGYGYGPGYPGGHGGGLIRIEASREIRVDGLLTANGTDVPNQWPGAGSGGGIYLVCDAFSGASGAVLRANGANAYSASPFGGGGGGGRIAVWQRVSAASRQAYIAGHGGGVLRLPEGEFPTFAGSVLAANGTGWKNPDDPDGAYPGTRHFFLPRGSLIQLR